MNLRTITCWIIYNPKQKDIVASRPYKYLIERCHVPKDCVVIQMTGHYVRKKP